MMVPRPQPQQTNRFSPRQKFLALLSGLTILVTILALIPRKKPSSPITNTALSLETVKNQVIANLPYSTDGFEIQYDAGSDSFMVVVTNTPFATYRDQGYQWLRNQGVTADKYHITDAIPKIRAWQ